MKARDGKYGLVVSASPERYDLIDNRLMKPILHNSYKSGVLKGRMIVQDIDEVSLNNKNKITYFVPNNIALLLSVSEKSLNNAKRIYSENFLDEEKEFDLNKMTENRDDIMKSASSLVCDYLENIQTSIVFGYTALEAFVNLSIPDGYEYTSAKNSKGISETYDKKAIERWLSLRFKVKSILSEIYNTKKIDSQKWWGHFLNLESYRNEIIHQKSISHTEFYKVYFKQSTFKVCQSPIELITYFHDSHAEDNKTNPLWPWIQGVDSLPSNEDYDSSTFEVVGNLYEGFKRKY
ncbi:MAG: hypothetical protein ACJAS1_005417 [Oleiphilaceae bacterium]|jgi:hypothetical protein